MVVTILANLPSTSEINPESFVLIERPGIGAGSYKSTVGDLQEAITCHANVTQEDNITRIWISDINGVTEETIFTPLADVSQDENITTIKITDVRGTTEETIFTPIATVNQEDNITTITITDVNGETQEQIVTPLANVVQEDNVTTITITDVNGTTKETIVTPTAKIVDNGDNTATITITDTEGTTTDTIVSRIILDAEPVEDSPNFLTSGTIYQVQQALSGRIDTDDGRLDSAENRISDAELRLSSLENRMLNAEVVTARAITVEEGQELDDPFNVDGVRYDTLSDAILDAAQKGSEVRLVSNASTNGIAVPEGSEFVLDLNGFDLELEGPGAGSPGTETNGFQFLKGSTVTIRNGVLNFDDDNLKIGIQNYSDLILDNVQITGGSTVNYVVSNNFGNVVFKNGTTITAYEGKVAFDCLYGMLPEYDDGVNVTIEDNTVVINGKVEFGKKARASAELFATNASITCPSDMNLDVRLLNEPCQWTNDEDNTKTLRYVYQAS